MTLVISREESGLVDPKYVNTGDMPQPSTGHWNGPTITVGGQTTWTHDKCDGLVRGIQSFHMKARGWADIAYNFIICPHGHVFVCRNINVWNGANGTNSGNKSSHAIMFLARQNNGFNEKEKQGFRYCVNHIAQRSRAPGDRAQGHRDHKATECPGADRYGWIHAGMPLVVPDPTPPPSRLQKETDMEAALNLIRFYYDKYRGKDWNDYNVEASDPPGWASWNRELLKAQDEGKPLWPVVELCRDALKKEASSS